MAVYSGFLRESRFEGVGGCPLAQGGAAQDDAACAGCLYNVLNPEQPRVGCAINTTYAEYSRAMDRLRQISADQHQEVEQILAAQRRAASNVGLEREQLEALAKVAESWSGLVSNDNGEAAVVTTILRFSRAALATNEPVRILS